MFREAYDHDHSIRTYGQDRRWQGGDLNQCLLKVTAEIHCHSDLLCELLIRSSVGIGHIVRPRYVAALVAVICVL
jgi:hypothetical protein